MTETTQPTSGAPDRPVTAQSTTPPATGTDTVTIGCKIPNGIVLRAFEFYETDEGTPTGSRRARVTRAIPGAEFTLAGNNGFHFLAPNLVDMIGRVFPGNGYSISPGVPRDLWENWLSFNKDSPLVQNGMVFCCDDEHDAKIEARSREQLVSGLAPIDPDDHAKVTGATARRINPIGGISAITTGSAE